MSLLDKDAKILTDKNADATTSTEGKVMSNRTVGSQGLRKFNKANFNSIIKKKAEISPEVTPSQEVIQVSAPVTILPAFVESKKIEPAQVNVVVKAIETIKEPVIEVKTAILPEVKLATAVIEEKLEVQIPETQVLNTLKTKAIADSKVFEIPKAKVIKKAQIPYQIPEHKVFEKLNQIIPIQEFTPTFLANYLRGNYLTIARCIFNEVVSNGGVVTPKLTLKDLSDKSGVNFKTLETIVGRFVKDQALVVVESRRGNSGYRIFAFDRNVFAYITKFSSIQIPYQIPENTPSKEGSIFKNNITNYSQPSSQVFEQKNFNFKELDFTEVSPLHWTQVNSSIRKLAEEKLEKEEMQLFVDKFMVWMSTQKSVQSVIGLFCAKIKEFVEQGESAIMQCLSKKELLAEKELKAQAMQLQQEQAMVDKYRHDVLNNSVDEKFNEWFSSLSDQEKINLVPEGKYAKLGSLAHNGALKAYFRDNLVGIV